MMNNACVMCFNLLVIQRPHPSLRLIQKGEPHKSDVFRCNCCYSTLEALSDETWAIVVEQETKAD